MGKKANKDPRWLAESPCQKGGCSAPGIIGVIASWLLKTMGAVATWLAKHLWA